MAMSAKKDGQKLISVAQRNSDRMITLINDLLDIEKIKSGMMELWSWHHLQVNKKFPILSRTYMHSQCSRSKWGQACSFKAKQSRTVMADEERARSACYRIWSQTHSSLVSARHDPISVWAEKKDNNGAYITVQDQGAGNTLPNMLESVFDRFQQVRGQSTSKR